MSKVVLHRKRTGDWYADSPNGHHYEIQHGTVGYNIERDDDNGFVWRFAETLAQVRICIEDEITERR